MRNMPKKDTMKVKKYSRKRYVEFAGIRVKDPYYRTDVSAYFRKKPKMRTD
jgi:hypothetical protein